MNRDAAPAFSGEILLSPLRDRARQPAAGREARNNPSCSEALAAGTMRHRIWIRDLEPTLLEIVAVIEQRSTHEERALWIDHHAHIRRLHHDVAIGRPVHEVHLVLQPGATAADHGYSKGSVGR